MVETTKTKTHESILENSWIRDVIIPVALIILAAIILWWVKNTTLIPDMFKPFILASGVLLIAAAILETLIIFAKILDFLATNITKHWKKLL
ncbi:hypothetical protein [Pyrococcus kukulkanii]|uniref:hypothetical protein n=1 Tax=Pyrococcus kukulkanii TaxID=1609559 RepID=UPI00356B1D95